MTIPTQHNANLSEDSYRLDHKVGYHPPGRRDKVRMDGVVYEVVEFVDNKKTGYQGVIYQRVGTGEIIVAHRGTEFDREPLKDGWHTDGGMVAKEFNLQTEDAIALTRHALSYAQNYADRKKVPVPEVTHTGHSLGGCHAQTMAHHFDHKAETFNAYGAAGLKGINPNEPNAANVTNHVMAGDVVSAASPHYGKVVMYATPKEIDRLSRAGYGDAAQENDLKVVVPLVGSHRMKNFLDDPATPGRNESALANPESRNLANANRTAIDEYRSEVRELRERITTASQQDAKGFYETIDKWNRGLESIAQATADVAETAQRGVRQGAEWMGEKADQAGEATRRGVKHAQDRVEDGVDWAGKKAGQAAESVQRSARQGAERARDIAEQATDAVKRGAGNAKDAAVDGWNALDKKADEIKDEAARMQQKFNDAGKKIGDWLFNRPTSAVDVDRAMDGVRPYLPAKDADLRDTIRDSAGMANAQANATPHAGSNRTAAPTLESDPSAFLDRMLAAAKSGDADTFRQMTQQAADGEGGRALREQAIAGVDRQEQLAREQAERSALEEAAARTARQAGPVMG